MTIKNQSKRKQTLTAEIGKRYSKAKMKREIVSENTSADKIISVVKTTTEPKKYVCTAVERYQFKGEPKRIYSATIKRNSSPQKGYDVLSAGQQVTVEDFGGSQPLRITSMDGRVGITCVDNIKSFFS